MCDIIWEIAHLVMLAFGNYLLQFITKQGCCSEENLSTVIKTIPHQRYKGRTEIGETPEEIFVRKWRQQCLFGVF